MEIPDDQESRLAVHRTEIETQIAEGYESAQRGELISAEEVRARLNQRKSSRATILLSICKEL